MKKIFLALILSFITLSTFTTGDTVTAYDFKLTDEINYLSIEEGIVIAGNITSSKMLEEVKQYLNEDHIIFIYNLNGELRDILYDEEITDGIGMIYYYDENDTLHRIKITQENLRKNRMSYHLSNEFTKTLERTTKIKANKDKDLQNGSPSSVCDFGNPKMIYENTHINGEYGYFITKHNLYRCNVEEQYLFRVDSYVQFVSGNAAVDSSYNSDYQSDYALITGKLKKHIEYGYGTWYSAQPNSLDYWPISNQSISNEDTNTNSQMNVNAQWLSQSKGAGWEYTEFNTSSDQAVDVYQGMLIETKPASPYTMNVNGEYHVNVILKVRKERWPWEDIVKQIESQDIIYLDVHI